MLCWN